MRTLTGVPRHYHEPPFVPGGVGVEDFASPGILVLPRSVSFTTLQHVTSEDVVTTVHVVTMEDGSTRPLSGRFVRRIGPVTVNPETNEARWADEDGQ